MEISVEQRDRAAVMTITGDLVADFERELSQSVANLLDGGATLIVMDMSAVPFVNSGGLSMLVTAAATANTRGGRVVLAGLTPFFEQVLATTRLNKFFESRPTVQDACKA